MLDVDSPASWWAAVLGVGSVTFVVLILVYLFLRRWDKRQGRPLPPWGWGMMFSTVTGVLAGLTQGTLLWLLKASLLPLLISSALATLLGLWLCAVGYYLYTKRRA